MGNGQWAKGDCDAHDVVLDELTFGFAEEGDAIRDHRDLEVWQIAMTLSVSVYAATRCFPREEVDGLTSQLRRASVSIPANIAEGYGRYSTGAYIQFLKVALGSTRELSTLLDLSNRLGFLDSDDAAKLNKEGVRIVKMLFSLIKSLQRRQTE